MNPFSSLEKAISPPPLSRQTDGAAKKSEDHVWQTRSSGTSLSSAAIEAGRAKIRDHLDYFSSHLSKAVKPRLQSEPRLSIDDFVTLYQRNQHINGCHFVIHQHNHPIAGVHYDLRLQFSDTSTVSFAVPYGLPGNPNSRRQGRMAIETRVHNLWNNLIETGSRDTGSLLIWDTGEYSILPRKTKKLVTETEDELSDTLSDTADTVRTSSSIIPENEKLIQAFQSRYIRLRLHGTRLPENYTITLRLPSTNNNFHQPNTPSRKRGRKKRRPPASTSSPPTDSSESGFEDQPTTSSSALTRSTTGTEEAAATASDDDASSSETEASKIRASNAYTGATNSIGSVHQRHWFLQLDKPNSGFVKATVGPRKGEWVALGFGGAGSGFETFFVRGAEVERSVVTGRTSGEVLADEGVEGFRARKMWRAVLE